MQYKKIFILLLFYVLFWGSRHMTSGNAFVLLSVFVWPPSVTVVSLVLPSDNHTQDIPSSAVLLGSMTDGGQRPGQ